MKGKRKTESRFLWIGEHNIHSFGWVCFCSSLALGSEEAAPWKEKQASIAPTENVAITSVEIKTEKTSYIPEDTLREEHTNLVRL